MVNRLFFTTTACLLFSVCGPVTADTPAEKKADVPSLESLHAQLKEIHLSLQTMKATDTDLRLRKLEAEIAILKNHLEKMEASVGKLSVTRSAGSYTPPVAATATLKVANSSPHGATVVVNGKSHRVAALQTITLSNQNVGDFTYEVHADGFGLIHPNTTRSVASNETFTISIFPR
ncbi:MAG: hypothetical protein EXR99_14930 [Gemmataceae bacterium]|nr:hypothetical protein [Gemmataceae bacterium]